VVAKVARPQSSQAHLATGFDLPAPAPGSHLAKHLESELGHFPVGQGQRNQRVHQQGLG
jgi:hypothetical protein